MASSYFLTLLEKLRAKERVEDDDSEEGEEGRREREEERDSLFAKLSQQEQLEESDRVRRALASRVQKQETSQGFRFLVKHKQPVTSVALFEDDSRGFLASNDDWGKRGKRTE